MFDERFKSRLERQLADNLYRDPPVIDSRDGKYIIIDGVKYLNFSSNDYLGLASSKKIHRITARCFSRYGSSASSSRMVCGNFRVINEAEKVFANYFGYDDALFFPSGYQANIALLSCLFESGDHIFFDKHIHASSVKGLQLSPAAYSGFNHNDFSHLEKRLAGSANPIVLTESLFSMDGDVLDAASLASLKRNHKFYCIVDEAHSLGVLGGHGKGIARECANIAVGTLGKAFGLFGAFVLVPQGVREYMYNYSSPLIYTTALPPSHAAAAMQILSIVEKCDNERKHLKEISSYAKQKINSSGFQVKGDAHILAIGIGNEQKAEFLAKKLFENKLFVFTARYPTVPLHKAILRISLTAQHDKRDIDTLAIKLIEAERSYE